jgi:TFIIF-interacting CTD phosphatase-like protein
MGRSDDVLRVSFKFCCILTVKVKLQIRPHAKNFLLEAYKNYTLVLYTAGTQDYADKILTYLGIP